MASVFMANVFMANVTDSFISRNWLAASVRKCTNAIILEKKQLSNDFTIFKRPDTQWQSLILSI